MSEHESLSDVIRREMAEQGLTFRAFRARTREHEHRGKGLSEGYLVALAKGERRATSETIEVIANSLGVDPWSLTEYRLAYYRRALDERPPPEGVGPESAVLMLRLIEEVLAPARGEDPVAILDEAFERAGLLAPHAGAPGTGGPAAAQGEDAQGEAA